jgi:hypothetical protein
LGEQEEKENNYISRIKEKKLGDLKMKKEFSANGLKLISTRLNESLSML